MSFISIVYIIKKRCFKHRKKYIDKQRILQPTYEWEENKGQER